MWPVSLFCKLFMLSPFSLFCILFFFSHSSPEFVPFLCSLLFFFGGQHNCIFVHKRLHFKTIQLLRKHHLSGLVLSSRVDLQLLTRGSQTQMAFCFFCSFPCFLSLPCSLWYFEACWLSDRYGRLFPSCSDDTLTMHAPPTLHRLHPAALLPNEALMSSVTIQVLFNKLAAGWSLTHPVFSDRGYFNSILFFYNSKTCCFTWQMQIFSHSEKFRLLIEN